MDDAEVMEVRMETFEGIMRFVIPDPDRIDPAEIGRKFLAMAYLASPKMIGGRSQTAIARACQVKKQCIQKLCAKIQEQTGIKVARQHQSTTTPGNPSFRHDVPLASGGGSEFWTYHDAA